MIGTAWPSERTSRSDPGICLGCSGRQRIARYISVASQMRERSAVRRMTAACRGGGTDGQLTESDRLGVNEWLSVAMELSMIRI